LIQNNSKLVQMNLINVQIGQKSPKTSKNKMKYF
jgi:hypothetical protein